MIAQIRSELLKIRSTRTTIGLLLGMIALILLFTLLTGLLSHPPGLMGKENQRQLLSLGSIAGVFSALAGVLLVTSEYRYGTIRPTILFNPARSHVLTAKIVAGALAGIVFGVLGEAIGWAIGYAILEGRGITIVLSSQRRPAARARRARRRGLVGSDRYRPRHDHPQPGRRRHHPARLGLRRRQPSVRPRALRGPVHANTRVGRADGPQDPASALARRRRDHPDRLGDRAGLHRHRPNRPARHQLTPRTRATASRHRRINRPDVTPRRTRKPLALPVVRRAPRPRADEELTITIARVTRSRPSERNATEEQQCRTRSSRSGSLSDRAVAVGSIRCFLCAASFAGAASLASGELSQAGGGESRRPEVAARETKRTRRYLLRFR